MEILLYAAGVIIMAIAIALSIALHEVGHLYLRNSLRCVYRNI